METDLKVRGINQVGFFTSIIGFREYLADRNYCEKSDEYNNECFSYLYLIGPVADTIRSFNIGGFIENQ